MLKLRYINLKIEIKNCLTLPLSHSSTTEIKKIKAKTIKKWLYEP